MYRLKTSEKYMEEVATLRRDLKKAYKDKEGIEDSSQWAIIEGIKERTLIEIQCELELLANIFGSLNEMKGHREPLYKSFDALIERYREY
jgi:hypothetical protein